MKSTLISIGAIVAGVLVGSIINFGTLLLGMNFIQAPAGVDFNIPETIAANIHLFEFKHFIFPFLAHALGTLSGAILAIILDKNNQMRSAFTVGVFFLIGGSINVYMIPAPLWFNISDLVFAYLPMSWLALQSPFSKSA
jgi:hypothetical protein